MEILVEILVEILPQRFVRCEDVDATISQCLQSQRDASRERERERESLIRLIRNKNQHDEALTHATEYGLQLGYDLGTGAATAWGLFMPSLVVWNTPYFLPRFPTFQPPVSSRRAVNISISTIWGPSKFTQKMYLANSSESWKKGYLKISSKSGFSNSPRVWASINKLHDLCIRNHSHFFKRLFDGPSPLFPSIYGSIVHPSMDQ